MADKTETEGVDGSSCVPASDIAAIASAATDHMASNPYKGQILDTDGHMYLEPEPLAGLLDGLPDLLFDLPKFRGQSKSRSGKPSSRS